MRSNSRFRALMDAQLQAAVSDRSVLDRVTESSSAEPELESESEVVEKSEETKA